MLVNIGTVHTRYVKINRKLKFTYTRLENATAEHVTVSECSIKIHIYNYSNSKHSRHRCRIMGPLVIQFAPGLGCFKE